MSMKLTWYDGKWHLSGDKRYIDARARMHGPGEKDKLDVGELRMKKVLNSPLKDIAKAVAKAHGIQLRSIMADVRTKPVVYARWHIWLLAMEHTSLSMYRIAHITSRDHTTMLYALPKIKRMRDAGSAHIPHVII